KYIEEFKKLLDKSHHPALDDEMVKHQVKRIEEGFEVENSVTMAVDNFFEWKFASGDSPRQLQIDGQEATVLYHIIKALHQKFSTDEKKYKRQIEHYVSHLKEQLAQNNPVKWLT